MPILKSLFISGFLSYAWIASAYAGWQLLQGQGLWLWGGALMANAPFALMIGWWMLARPVARTSADLLGLRLLNMAGCLMAFFGSLQADASARDAAQLAVGLALGGLIGTYLYVRWYSRFGRQASSALQPGSRLPDFTLRSASGKSISSSDLQGQPTILLFYRGNWCPLCMAQIREISQQYRDLSEAGVRVALISPQPHENTVSLARKFDVPFEFLTDEDNRAAQALGIAAPQGLPAGMQVLGYDSDTVMPTVIILNAQGEVLWRDETDNYRVRPEPQTFVEVLRSHDLIQADASGG